MNHLNNMKVKPITIKDKTKSQASRVNKINFSGFNSPKLSLSMKNEPNKSKGMNILPVIPLKFVIQSQLINYKFDVYNSVSLNKPSKKINDNLYKRLLGSKVSPLLIPEVKEGEDKSNVNQQKQINNEHKDTTGEQATFKKLKQTNVIKVERLQSLKNNDQYKTCEDNTTINNDIRGITNNNIKITQSNYKNNLTNPISTTQTHHIRVLRTNMKQIRVSTPNNNETNNKTISVDTKQLHNNNQKDNNILTPKESISNPLPTINKIQNTNTKSITNEQHQQQQKKETKYTYCVLPGNNSKLIITCMKTRPKWEQCETYLHLLANLYWTPLSSNINFTKHENICCQYVNHIEYHSELSNKMNLFVNLLRYCEQNELDLFSFFPLTIIFPLFHESFFEQTFHFSSFYKEHNTIDTNNIKYNKYFSIFSNKKLGAIQTLTIPSTHNAGNNLWLIKPINFNRGRYIKIINNLNEILNELHKLRNAKSLSTINNEHHNKSKHRKNNTEYILLQKYIERPLTYKNRKFDIRMWVMYTFKDELFVFREGHLKATSDNYDVNSIDPYVHLTNYSVQKHNSNFSKEEIGNEISFKSFQEELNKMKSGIKFKKDILPKIHNIIRITFKAVQKKIIFYGKRKCFEIFGYDFLIDEEFNPFLIEINTNPGLEESSPLIKMLVHRMVDDAFKLTIDEEYNRDDEYMKKSPFEVEGYSNDINMWMKLNKCK